MDFKHKYALLILFNILFLNSVYAYGPVSNQGGGDQQLGGILACSVENGTCINDEECCAGLLCYNNTCQKIPDIIVPNITTRMTNDTVGIFIKWGLPWTDSNKKGILEEPVLKLAFFIELVELSVILYLIMGRRKGK